MIVCPVCEHAQAEGAECEVCGKKLLRGAAAVPFVPPVEGLEPTLHADVDAGAPLLPELEPTGHAAADVPDGGLPLDLETGRAPPVDVPAERLPDLERAAADAAGDLRTAIPVIVTCRYCRSPAGPGERICGRCGMRLPVFEAEAPEGPPPLRRCSCGATVRVGPLCPTCGARLA
jgi:hypothetical protein